jgi:hypothetical protein
MQGTTGWPVSYNTIVHPSAVCRPVKIPDFPSAVSGTQQTVINPTRIRIFVNALWDTWLDTVIEPLLDSHRMEWSTFEEIAAMYESWEAIVVPE